MEANRPKSLRVPEVAKLFELSERTVRNMLHDGRLTGVRVTGHERGRWAVPEDEVERRLAQAEPQNAS